ncbi:MAG: TonB-dependent receptor [Rhodospirillaceae bacterium]|nr:TonB-dependent receptor [Rhodospirillaceae bacterium]
MSYGFRFATATAVGALMAAFTTPASAQAEQRQQSAQAPSLEEIVVTARKREESLLEIPVAITAFSAADIERADVFDIREITKFAPGFQFRAVGGNGGGGRSNPFVIFRGMTMSSTLPRQSTGAVFIDGVYVLGGTNSVNTVDVERVEVIKGPQNAYFGRNTFGGAINFITKTPSTDEVRGEVSAEASTRDSYDVNFSVEGPLVEGRLAGRVTTVLHQKGPHYTANDGGELGEETTESITATLYATPSDNFWIKLRGHYQEDDDGAPATSHLYAPLHGNASTSCAGLLFDGADAVTKAARQFAVSLPYFCNNVPTIRDIGEKTIVTANTRLASPRLAGLGNPNGLIDGFVNNILNDPLVARAPRIDHFGLVRENRRFNGQAEYEFASGITTALNVGYDKTKQNSIFDQDRSDVENLYTTVPAIFRVVTVEGRVQSPQDQVFRWMVGATYYDGDFDGHFNGELQYQVRTVPTAPIARAVTTNVPINRDGERAKVKAGFMALQYDVTEQLELNGELRYQQDKSKTAPSNPASLTASFKDWLPRVIVNYKPQDDWTLYASWARGVLPGQFNQSFITATATERSDIEAVFPGIANVVESEKVDSYEVGSKQQLFDSRVQYTLAGYYMKWSNIKAGAAFVAPSTGRTITGLITPGNATLKGIEWDGTMAIAEGFNFNLRGAWQIGKYTNFIQPFLAQLTSNATRFDGKRLSRVPKWSGSAAIDYEDRLAGDWNWFGRFDVSYTGKAWDSEANIVQFNDYFRANARVGVEDENLRVELFVKNLFDDQNWDFGFRNVYQGNPVNNAIFIPLPAPFTGFGFPQGIIAQPPDKREFGLRMRYNF